MASYEQDFKLDDFDDNDESAFGSIRSNPHSVRNEALLVKRRENLLRRRQLEEMYENRNIDKYFDSFGDF
ncbi:MAG: hypothetical protein HWE10_11070 [Gammaproteobacteria bacterium]|nr:hypothetical protein [Gammaproteobacteria bacterium]